MFCDVKKAHIYPAIIYVVTNHTAVCFIRRQNDLKTIFICLSSTVNSLSAEMATRPSQANRLEPTFDVMEHRVLSVCHVDYHTDSDRINLSLQCALHFPSKVYLIIRIFLVPYK